MQTHDVFLLSKQIVTVILTTFFCFPWISRDAGYERVFRSVGGPLEGEEGPGVTRDTRQNGRRMTSFWGAMAKLGAGVDNELGGSAPHQCR